MSTLLSHLASLRLHIVVYVVGMKLNHSDEHIHNILWYIIHYRVFKGNEQICDIPVTTIHACAASLASCRQVWSLSRYGFKIKEIGSLEL